MKEIQQNFSKKLKEGEETEQHLLSIVQEINPLAYKVSGNNKYLDIVIDKNNSIELKDDVMARMTGNFAFEIFFRGKPSGIAVTKATWFVVSDDDNYYFFNTVKLKDWFKANWELLNKVTGGDDMDSKIILVKKTDVTNQGFCTPFKKDAINYTVLKEILF